MLDIGMQELLVVMVLALLIFGPDKLPELGRRLGRAMREFRRASDEFRSTVEQNLQMSPDHDTSSPSPSSSFEPATVSAPDAPAPGSGVVAEAHGDVAPVTTLGGEAPAELPLEPFWTSRGGRLLHRRDCAWRARVPVGEQVPLKTALEGWEQGLKPCPVCDPKEIAVAS